MAAGHLQKFCLDTPLGGAAQMPAAASASGNNSNLPPIRNADAILGFARRPQSHLAENESQHPAMRNQPMDLEDSWIPAARSTVTPDILPGPNSMPRLHWPAFSGLPTSRENLEDMGRAAILIINELMRHIPDGNRRKRALDFLDKYGPAPSDN